MQAILTVPRNATLDTLRASRNRAADRTLLSGLESPLAAVRHGCLKTLIERKSETTYREIILRWSAFDSSDTELLRTHAERFAQPASDLLANGSLSEKRTALTAIGELDLNQSIDTVLEIVADKRHALCAQATKCLIAMCERWGGLARQSPKPVPLRAKMIERLHHQILRYQENSNDALIEAWLCCVHWDDAAQRGLISNPSQAAYRPLLNCLRTSTRPAVLQLLAGYALRGSNPAGVQEILIERCEFELAQKLESLLDEENLNAALKRLRQTPPLACLEKWDPNAAPMSFQTLRHFWLMLAASSQDLARVLEGAIALSKLGTLEGREAAAEMLRQCRRQDLEALLPKLQAAAFLAPEEPNLEQALQKIAVWSKSPSANLRDAANDFLSEFTVERLLDLVRHWPTQMCRPVATIVALIHGENTAKLLSDELRNPAPKRRLAALQAIELAGCVQPLLPTLTTLLEDPRLEVRVRTVDVLAAHGPESLEQLIPALLQDASTDMQDAAKRAARKLQRDQNPPASQTPTST